MLDMVATPALRACAERGVPRAQAYLGMVYWAADASYDSEELGIEPALSVDELRATGTQWLESAARLGSAEAQNELGLAYLDGEFGFAVDSSKAFERLSAAAAQGDPRAEYNLASMHFSGRATPRSAAHSIRLLWSSALRGYGPATCALAFINETNGDAFSAAIFRCAASAQEGGGNICSGYQAEIAAEFPAHVSRSD